MTIPLGVLYRAMDKSKGAMIQAKWAKDEANYRKRIRNYKTIKYIFYVFMLLFLSLAVFCVFFIAGMV
jgi:hypothetical protein